MTIAVMQPYFFPYIGYWQMINAVDTFVIYDDVNFIKKGYINRNTILINNKAHRFTLELLGASQNKYINEITVGDNTQKLLKTIHMAYNKAPLFNVVYPLIEDILTYEDKNLAKYIRYSLSIIMNYLQIDTNLVCSSELNITDILRGEERIISICKTLNATQYINAIGGQDLYNKENFYAIGLDLNFIKSNKIKYKQFTKDYVPALSIIDILMFNEVDTIRQFLKDYKIL